MFKVNYRNTKTTCEICSKLTTKTPERHSGVFIVNFEHISRLVLVFLLLTLNMYLPVKYKSKQIGPKIKASLNLLENSNTRQFEDNKYKYSVVIGFLN